MKHEAVFGTLVVAAVAFTAGAWAQNARFADVNESNPHKEAIEWAADRGILEGRADGLFRPDLAVTRGQVASILKRAFDQAGVSVPATTPTTTPPVVIEPPSEPTAPAPVIPPPSSNEGTTAATAAPPASTATTTTTAAATGEYVINFEFVGTSRDHLVWRIHSGLPQRSYIRWYPPAAGGSYIQRTVARSGYAQYAATNQNEVVGTFAGTLTKQNTTRRNKSARWGSISGTS